MKYRKISASSIAKVDCHGIYFANGNRLHFEKCLAVRQRIYPSSRAVADRDITADPPYFEFYAAKGEIPIRIVFDQKGLFAQSRNHRKFHALWQAVKRAGYQTYDLS